MSGKPLHQKPLLTSFMGAVLGAADYFDYPSREPFFFGGSGAAFQLEYSGAPGRNPGSGNPPEEIRMLLPNLGVEYRDLGCFGPDVTAAERNRLESGLKSLMSRGVPCAVNLREYQLITGFDEDGFLLESPPSSPANPFPGRLSFGTWHEFPPGRPLSFHAFRRTAQASQAEVFLKSIGFLSDRNGTKRNPGGFLSVYDRWIRDYPGGEDGREPFDFSALAECREMASAFFREAAELRPEVSPETLRAAEIMESVSAGFRLLAGRPANQEAVEALAEIREAERLCMKGVERIAGAFRH